MTTPTVEPWLRGTLTEVPAVARGVLHALELAAEDVAKSTVDLSDSELHARPLGLPSIAFQFRHIARSVDRLLTYAEGGQLSAGQLEALSHEGDASGSKAELLAEFQRGIDAALLRIPGFVLADLQQARGVGRKALPTTIGGLLVHCADHTQRHTGQLVTTARMLAAS